MAVLSVPPLAGKPTGSRFSSTPSPLRCASAWRRDDELGADAEEDLNEDQRASQRASQQARDSRRPSDAPAPGGAMMSWERMPRTSMKTFSCSDQGPTVFVFQLALRDEPGADAEDLNEDLLLVLPSVHQRRTARSEAHLHKFLLVALPIHRNDQPAVRLPLPMSVPARP